MRRFLLLVLGLASLLASGPALSQEQSEEFVRIGKMELKELASFTATVAATVGQDTLKLQPAAKAGDCLELTRISNGFALAYRMLAAADEALAGKPAKEGLPIKARIVQSRVITFAARVRAEEWLTRTCSSFAIPADKAGEPRYAKPVKLQTVEFTEAVIEARQAAEANLAAAIAAGISNKCPEVLSAMQSIQLFVPYLEKLAKDVATRPEALGPRASRRGLEVARGQLINAGNKLYREVGIGCMSRPPASGAPSSDPTGRSAPEAAPPAAQ